VEININEKTGKWEREVDRERREGEKKRGTLLWFDNSVINIFLFYSEATEDSRNKRARCFC
jgi:hypothetical protein